METKRKRWFERIPHPVVMLFGIILFAAAASYILPAGEFEKQVMVNGREGVVPGTYHEIKATPVGLLDLFKAFSIGFKEASDIIFLVLVSGAMFGILEKSRMVENSIGTLVKVMGLRRKFIIVILMTFIYGLLGVFVGYENNIALIPIAAILSLAIGGDLILAAGISIGAMTVGFGLSPFNLYTVGIGHQIAEMPMFSGALLRGVLCFLALSLMAWYNVRYFKKIIRNKEKGLGEGLDTSGFQLSQEIKSYSITANNWIVMFTFIGGLAVMLLGVFKFKWHLAEISGLFIVIAILAAIVSKMDATTFSETALKAIGLVAPGAFMVGYARTISVVLTMGSINETIAFELSEMLKIFPTYLSVLFMSLSQCGMNLLIPSGSGQALATLPIMIPLGDVIGLTRQTSILAFQIGDGVTNLFNPTLGGLIAMLSLCRVPFDRWLRFIFPLTMMLLVLAWIFLLFSVFIEWGPA